jgi:L-seryl-tRNA(Ser) seleniumtransferase
VERLLVEPLLVDLGGTLARWIVVDSAREVLAEMRSRISEGRITQETQLAGLAAEVKARALARSKRVIRKVINATGVVIHTNLGRSVLAQSAIAAMEEVARSYSSLEYDLVEGARTSRTAAVDRLISKIVGSEDGFCVNNNAGAVLMALNTVCDGRETIVSRGELVEIGGSFRLPDVMEKSGSRLVEVGTTNRTRLEDYEAAVGPDTAAILKVHPSNFAMTGFVESPSLRDLAELAHRRGIVLIEDLGSGALVDLSEMGLEKEPMPQQSVADGVDVVTFSGDKLLGGPQAGIIVGRSEPVSKMKTNPLARALRLDKMTLAALEETLRLYLAPEGILTAIPTLRMLASPVEEIERRARRVAGLVSAQASGVVRVAVVKSTSQVGGGSLPLAGLETSAVTITSDEHSPDRIVKMLRGCEPAIIARIVEDKVYIDLRTVQPSDDDLLAQQVVAAFRGQEWQRGADSKCT